MSIYTVNEATDKWWTFQGVKYAIKRYDSAFAGEGVSELDIMNFINGEWVRFAGIKNFTEADVIAAGGVVAFLVLAITAINATFKLRGLDPDAGGPPPVVVPDPTLSITAQIDQTIPYLFGVETTTTGIRIVQLALPGQPGYVAPAAAPVVAASTDAPAAGASTGTGDIPADLAAAIAAGTPVAPGSPDAPVTGQ